MLTYRAPTRQNWQESSVPISRDGLGGLHPLFHRIIQCPSPPRKCIPPGPSLHSPADFLRNPRPSQGIMTPHTSPLGVFHVGIREQARNVTDTSLKQIVSGAADPAAALKDHVLRLEASLRDLVASEEVLARQCAWLNANIERNLKAAEAEEARAARLLQLDREDAARQALADKRDSLIQVTTDRRRLLQLENSLPGLRPQIQELRDRIDHSRALRARLVAGQPLQDDDFHRPGAQPYSPPAPPDPSRSAPTGPDQSAQSADDTKELDRELERLRRRLDPRKPQEGVS